MAERRDRLDQPREPRGLRPPRFDPEAFGQWTERVARFLGTGRYLIIQTMVVVGWIGWNVLTPKSWQDDRDRVNLEEDRGQGRQAKADLEYLARELAAVRIALGEVVTRDFLRSELTRLDGSRDQT